MKEEKLEELSEQYRNTGVWTDEMDLVQNKHILKNIQKYYDIFVKNEEDMSMRFETYIGLMIGTWQANNGFYRTTEQVRERFRSKRGGQEDK